MIRQSAPLQVATVAYSCVGVSRVTIRLRFARIVASRFFLIENVPLENVLVAASGRTPSFARAAPSMTAMDITIHSTVERLRLVLRTEVLCNG
jgi:hypothetical protein